MWEGAEPEFLAADRRERAHLDHIIPECRNGPTSLDNTVIVCQMCNLAKGASALGDPEFVMWLAERRAETIGGMVW